MTFVPDKGGLEADTAAVCSEYCKMDGLHEDGDQHRCSNNTVTKATDYLACPAKSVSVLSV
jgi:hypothetical protein